MNPKDRAGAKKPNLSVLPFAPLLDVIPALYEGRRKYGPWNWRAEEVSETIYADAAIRHLMQFISGEDIDPDSGVHHISKAIAGLLVVRDAQIHGCSIDDRYVNQDLQIDKQIEQLAGVNERYPEPVESALPPRPIPIPLVPMTQEEIDACHREEAENACGCEPIVMEVDGNTAILDPTAPVIDEGITGGETMTPEDAAKVAEYYGLQEAAEGRIEQVERFDVDKVCPGDTVVFANGKTAEVTEVDEDCSRGLYFLVDAEDQYDGLYTYYRADGTAEDPEDIVDIAGKGFDRILTIGNQTLLTFELGKPTCGLEVKTDGSCCSWSAPQAGGGSYELTPEDVGKTVILRNGEEGKIGIWDEDSIWPARVGVNGVLITNCSIAGCASSSCDKHRPYVKEECDYDIVRVNH